MEYFESNFFNTSYIVPFHEKRPFYLCGKDQLFSSRHLDLIFQTPKYWTLLTYNDHIYYTLWIPDGKKTRTKHADIYQMGFYVVTRTPSLFDNHVAIVTNDTKWLLQHWNTHFLVTVPILKFVPRVGDHDIQIDYFIPNQYPLRKIVLDADANDVLENVLSHRGYTFVNGVSMFLEMNKSQKINDERCIFSIQKLFRARGHSLFHEMEPQWQELYYGHQSMHVADNPWFLANMGSRPVSLPVLNALEPIDDDIIMNPPFNNIYTLSSIKTQMLLNFDPQRWDAIRGPQWYDCPVMLDDRDAYYPNLHDFFIGITRTRSAWKWWIQNHQEYLDAIYETMDAGLTRMQITEYALTSVLHIYTHAKEYTPRLCYSRIRVIWQQIMKRFDPHCICVHRLIQRWAMKFSFIHTLRSKELVQTDGWEFQVPYIFMKDFIEMYGEKCKLFEKVTVRIYSGYARILLKYYEGFEKVTDASGQSHLMCNFNTMQVLRMMPENSSYFQFYHCYLKHRMQSRFQAIYQGFGMLPDVPSTAYPKFNGIHTVGFLIMNHIEKNKDLIYC